VKVAFDIWDWCSLRRGAESVIIDKKSHMNGGIFFAPFGNAKIILIFAGLPGHNFAPFGLTKSGKICKGFEKFRRERVA